jgi:hypothetical protein
VRYIFVLLMYCMYLCTVELLGLNLFLVEYWVHSAVLQCWSLHFTNAITLTERFKPFVDGYFSWCFPNELHSQTVDYDTQYQGTYSALRTWNGIFQNSAVSVADGRNSKFMQYRSALFLDIKWRINLSWLITIFCQMLTSPKFTLKNIRLSIYKFSFLILSRSCTALVTSFFYLSFTLCKISLKLLNSIIWLHYILLLYSWIYV